MDALILSCGTGGGHDSAGRAVLAELAARGHHAVMLNPYTLCGHGLAGRIDSLYVRTAQRAPRAFGAIYGAGELYRRLPFRSPVYYANGGMISAMQEYLEENHYDIVIMPHLFPAEILTNMKRRGVKIPRTMFIATDYCCIPFTEETDCDAYVIPAADLREDFTARGIPAEKLYPLGIPVDRSFEEVRLESGSGERRPGERGCGSFVLISGGSMGAGKIEELVRLLLAHGSTSGESVTRASGESGTSAAGESMASTAGESVTSGSGESGTRAIKVVVVCGSNRELYDRLKKRYGTKIVVVGHTDCMADYLRACALYITKPGGLSSTEAAVCGVPLVHMPPIPGCETRNAAYFRERNMSMACQVTEKGVEELLALLENREACHAMTAGQRSMIGGGAAGRICGLAERLVQEPEARPEAVLRFRMGAGA